MIPKPVLVTDATEDAVSLATVKEFLRLDGTADDAALAVVIKACCKQVESYLDRKLVNQTWDIFFDQLPYAYRGQGVDWWDGVREGSITEMRSSGGGFLPLPFAPLQSVTDFNTYGDDDVAVLFATSNYQVDTQSPVPGVALRASAVWPTTVLRARSGVRVRAVFGYGDATMVPADIKQAILMFINKVYENRGDNKDAEFFGAQGFTIPNTAQLLLAPYVRVKI